MHVVAIGPFAHTPSDTLVCAANRSGVDLDIYNSFHEAMTELADGAVMPDCIIATSEGPLRSIASWVRSRDGWFNLPIFALVPHPSESVFADAFACGADDAVLAHDVTGIQRRLTHLRRHDPAARPMASSGVALVASADGDKRRSYGKLLRQAGFEVSFASDARDLMAASEAAIAPTLLVTTPSFPPMGGDAAVRTVRTASRNPSLPAIVVDDRQGTTSGSGNLQAAGDVKGKLLFFAEEALRGKPAEDQRASERLHFATICAFRMAGLMEPTYGLTHNISREGLFVRTLDPPPSGSDVWLELRTFDDSTVHVRGTVVWRREVGQVGGTTPPGFGVRIDASRSPAADIESYVESYSHLQRHQGAVN